MKFKRHSFRNGMGIWVFGLYDFQELGRLDLIR